MNPCPRAYSSVIYRTRYQLRFSVTRPPCATEGTPTNENQYHHHCHHHECHHHHHYHHHHHLLAQRMPTSTFDHILPRQSIWGCPSSLFSVCFVFLALFLFQTGRAIANFRKRNSPYENSDGLQTSPPMHNRFFAKILRQGEQEEILTYNRKIILVSKGGGSNFRKRF